MLQRSEMSREVETTRSVQIKGSQTGQIRYNFTDETSSADSVNKQILVCCLKHNTNSKYCHFFVYFWYYSVIVFLNMCF